jgi:hypothetical protein
VRSERTLDQTSTGWVSKLRKNKQEIISVPCETAKAGQARLLLTEIHEVFLKFSV